MKELLLKQKQVLFFIIAGGLSAIVEIGSFKLFSVNIPKIFPKKQIYTEFTFLLVTFFLLVAELFLIIS